MTVFKLIAVLRCSLFFTLSNRRGLNQLSEISLCFLFNCRPVKTHREQTERTKSGENLDVKYNSVFLEYEPTLTLSPHARPFPPPPFPPPPPRLVSHFLRGQGYNENRVTLCHFNYNFLSLNYSGLQNRIKKKTPPLIKHSPSNECSSSWREDIAIFGFCTRKPRFFGFGVHCGLRIFSFLAFSFQFSSK